MRPFPNYFGQLFYSVYNFGGDGQGTVIGIGGAENETNKTKILPLAGES